MTKGTMSELMQGTYPLNNLDVVKQSLAIEFQVMPSEYYINFPKVGYLNAFSISVPGNFGTSAMSPRAICTSCMSVNYGEHSNCRNCGAPLPPMIYPSGGLYIAPPFLERIVLIANGNMVLIDDPPPFATSEATVTASHLIIRYDTTPIVLQNELTSCQLKIRTRESFHTVFRMYTSHYLR